VVVARSVTLMTAVLAPLAVHFASTSRTLRGWDQASETKNIRVDAVAPEINDDIMGAVGVLSHLIGRLFVWR